MKRKNIAFTLIELLVVITIITLITSWGVVYFFKQVSSLKLSSESTKIIDIIEDLDSQVLSREILDYSLNIDFNNNKRWLSYTINELWLDHRQVLDFNSQTLSWSLNTTYSSTGSSYAFKIFEGSKFQQEQVIDWADSVSITLSDNQEYKITATLSWSILNSIFVNYYSKDNIWVNTETYIELISIKNIDWTIIYDSVEIRNFNGKKSITWNISWTSTELEKVFLHFERDWIQQFIEIKK